MRYPPQILDQIKSRLSIVDEVRKVRPDLKKKGRYWWAPCPFHSEKTPSFHVREEGNYHCFGCGAHGDIFTFVMETQGLDFMSTIKELAHRAGVKLPEPEHVDPEARSKRDQGYQALQRAADFYQRSLPQSAGWEYLEHRQVSFATAEEFQLGYAPDGWTATRDTLTQEGFSGANLREVGLCLEGTRGKGDYDRFRNRLMFPIHDLHGRVVAFGGRILEKGEPKYLNSPETPFFSKSHLLYNLNRAKAHMRQAGYALLVEGYMDVIALWQAGVKTAVAPMGTSVTEDQLLLLWQQVSKVVVCLDGDAAGRNAAIRVAQKVLPVLEPGHVLQFIWLPDGEDPDSLIKNDGLPAFHVLLGKTTSLEDVLWQHLTAGKDTSQADSRAAIDADLQRLTDTIRNQTVKRAYKQALKDRLWQATRANMPARVGKKDGKNYAADAFVSAPAGRGFTQVEDPYARKMLALVLRWPAILPQAAEALGRLHLPPGSLSNLNAALLRGFTQGQSPAIVVDNIKKELFTELAADLLQSTGVSRLPDETKPMQLFAEQAAHRQSRQEARARQQLLLKATQKEGFNDELWQQLRQLTHSR